MISAIVIQNIYFTFDSNLTTNPMKQRLTILIALVLLLTMNILHAQPGIPLKDNGSVLFGKDIVIHDRPDRDQKLVAICSAFNGWLYAAYAYQSSLSMSGSMVVLKSEDNGISWNVMIDLDVVANNTFLTSIGLITTGNSVSALKLFITFTYADDPQMPYSTGFLLRYNGVTGVFEERMIRESPFYDMSVASDIIYPAINSNTGSMGVLYSMTTDMGDSLIFRSSGNSGISLDNMQIVSLSQKYIQKVSLSYGRSPSYPQGRYFACWEEKDEKTSKFGRIYTSHTEPNYNSPFTTPVRLDNIDPADANLCRNPTIACQVNNVDNDSSNMTEVILFEKYDAANNRNNIIGYKNLQAATSSHFEKFSFTNAAHNNLQPDICFNTFNSTFMATYFDSTDRKLPFLTKDINMANPNTWTVTSTGYNDSVNITAPHPKVSMKYDQEEGVNVWIAERSNGNGKAMFDAPYSTYTGTSEINSSEGTKLLGAYPNPCSSIVTIGFELQKSESVRILIRSITGQVQEIVTDRVYSRGRHEVKVDVSGLPEGIYIYKFQAGEFEGTGKIVIVK